MQRKAVSQQTEMSRPPVLCALAAQRATVPWRPEHSRWRSVPRSLTVCVLHRTSRCRSTRSFAAQPSPGDRSVERHGGLLHGLAGALLRFCAACRAVVRRFTTQPSPGDRFCRPPRRSASWPCQALRSGFAQQIAQALDVLPARYAPPRAAAAVMRPPPPTALAAPERPALAPMTPAAPMPACTRRRRSSISTPRRRARSPHGCAA